MVPDQTDLVAREKAEKQTLSTADKELVLKWGRAGPQELSHSSHSAQEHALRGNGQHLSLVNPGSRDFCDSTKAVLLSCDPQLNIPEAPPPSSPQPMEAPSAVDIDRTWLSVFQDCEW